MRTWSVLGSLLVLGMIVALPAAGYAQDSVMTGIVTDSTGAVLPGVTVTATNVDPPSDVAPSPVSLDRITEFSIMRLTVALASVCALTAFT